MTRGHLHSKALSSPLGSIDEEGDSILDESILDDLHSIEMAAPPFDSQPHSFASPHFLSPGEETWHNFPASHETPSFHPLNPQAASTYLPSYQSPDQPGNPPHYAAFTEHPASWQPINIDAKSRQSVSDGLASPYELKVEDSQHAAPMPPLAMSGSERYPLASSMASPQSENGWLSASSSSETKKTPKREAISRQAFATFPQHLRREGIRKKNARVEIPEGRTIDIIEEEIRQCNPDDEAKLKELKQFKRLLRNREAALSSRSRKKEHAQRLEEENKALSANFEKYDEMLRMKEGCFMREANRLSQIIDSQAAEKEEMVRRHTLETADLRKKISFLTEEAQRRADIPLSAVPSSAGFSNNTFSDFDPMTMGGSPQWDDFSFMNPSCMVEEVKPQESTLVIRQKDAKNLAREEEPAVSGLLLMLLLCGAWVASGNNTKSNPVPQMSEDVRAASAQVLHNIYKDAGLQPETGPSSTFNNVGLAGPGSAHHPSTIYTHPFDPQAMHSHLTAPSQQQECDQAFSMTADQYNHITTDWFSQQEQPKPASPPRRRNLADTLANLHLDKRTTATNAYTKSLLMDEVPAHVVRDFHRMVAENSGRRHSLQEPMN